MDESKGKTATQINIRCMTHIIMRKGAVCCQVHSYSVFLTMIKTFLSSLIANK